jgi:hypothetical protein
MPQTDDEFDRTPQGQEMVALLRRHAPPPPNLQAGRESVLARLPAGRMRSIHWLGGAAGAAAAVMIAFVLINRDLPKVEDNGVTIERTAPAAPLRAAMPELVAVVRGPSADGWRIDAGLKDGLRVGDRLAGKQGDYTVVAAGIFDSRVTGPALLRGERLSRPIDNAAMGRAASMASLGGDPGGFYEFGAVFEAMPVADARRLGISNGRALRVAETISAVLLDFEAQPQPTLAARIGLRAGDVIVQANGYSIADLNQLANALEWSRRSAMLQMTVIRNGRALELQTR